MLKLLKKVFGTANDRIIAKLKKDIEQINKFENQLSNLADIELKDKTNYFRELLRKGKKLDDIKYEAFAVVREAMKRTLGLRHFDVQLIGGLILHDGKITEMRTGEGKTLVATLPVYLNALEGKGVHVVTVNDYLAKRDSEWTGKIFNFLGLTVGCVTAGLSDLERKKAYEADITYATNNELGFDFLRDNMKFSFESAVMRPFNYAIIDEVDSILIDEARTPLIISGPVNENTDLYLIIDKLVKQLKTEDFEKDEKTKNITLTELGNNHIEKLLIQNGLMQSESSLYDIENMKLIHYVNQSLKAHHLFSKDIDYIISDGKVMIIDEFTGRIMDGRRYSDGLHQSLEAKEGQKVQNENQTLASITFQNYFRMYKKLAGMTGTAMTEAAELKDIYNIDVISVPTHHPVKRIDLEDEIYGSVSEKHEAIYETVKLCYEKGQPVLVGTVSIEKSEEISAMLLKYKIPHNVLNAKNHEKEASIIAQAGRFKAVTIATNMAGRGTDIMLGGNPDMVISELDSNFSIEQMQTKVNEIKKLHRSEKEQVIEAGGLYVIGTERHESRRIDNQLRGRSGRQGDPGKTKFFLSLEDDLIRIFASERMTGMLRNLGLKNGEAIHHPMISRSIEKAQQKVESHNYEIRKNLLKFDDVMNDQRKAIYDQRNDIILASDLTMTTFEFINQVVSKHIPLYIPQNSFRESWDLKGLQAFINSIIGQKIDITSFSEANAEEKDILEYIINNIEQTLKIKIEKYGENQFQQVQKYLYLYTLDQVWKDHLHSLDYLRQGISLRAYGQKDPLNEYRREAFELFEQMLDNYSEQVVKSIIQFNINSESSEEELYSLEKIKPNKMFETRDDPAFTKFNTGKNVETTLKPVLSYVSPELRNKNDQSTWGKISRNELCPCGSDKKYKHCHGS